MNSPFVKQTSAVLLGPELDSGITAMKAPWYLLLRGGVGCMVDK